MAIPSPIAYLDCFSGISGDMLLGALLDIGVEKSFLLQEVGKINGLDFQLSVVDEIRSGVSCKHVTVDSPSRQQFRHLHDILKLLEQSSLSPAITEKAAKAFTLLARAEAKVHNMNLEDVHFHEVGAVDTIVDIVGTLVGFHQLGVEKIICSPLPMGQGFVRCAHGLLPLPAPAVCELLRDIPVYGVRRKKELVTPTGAVLALVLADRFDKMPAMVIKNTGYGAGSNRQDDDHPNLLRLMLGETIEESSELVEIIETNLDDWNTETFPYLCDLLFAKGALDVSLSPLIMKKGRPGHLLRVITSPAHSLKLKEIILSETTAIGLRFRREERMVLEREAVLVETSWGAIIAKKVQTPKGSVIYPEYEACRKVAEKENIPLARVYETVSNVGNKSGER